MRAITDEARKRGDERAADLCNELGFHLQAMGELTAAKPYYEEALAIFEHRLGPSNPTAAVVRNNLAAVLAQLDQAHIKPTLWQRARRWLR